jgi:RimJ/RimL family protein N-acetyltransferase
MIAFPATLRLPVTNHLSGRRYSVLRCDHVEPTLDRLAEIVAICNEPEVYSWVFREVLSGRAYPTEKAMEWLLWASDGWRANTHFCFAVTDDSGAIVAACDIKSSNPDGAEIGYWASALHRGVMTNAVDAMCQAARQAGFRSLMARVRHENSQSQAVLARVGFIPDPSRRDETRDYFTLQLT